MKINKKLSNGVMWAGSILILVMHIYMLITPLSLTMQKAHAWSNIIVVIILMIVSFITKK